MRRMPKPIGRTSVTVLASFLLLCTKSPLYAEMTASQYATAWRNACVAEGVSRKITLTDYEKSTIKLRLMEWEAFLNAMKAGGMTGLPGTTAYLKDRCGCVAKGVTTKKKRLTDPTPDSVLDAAIDTCGY